MGVLARTRPPPGSDLRGDAGLSVDVDKQPNSWCLSLLSCTYGTPCGVRLPKPLVNHHTPVVTHRAYGRNSHRGENDGLRKRCMLLCIGVQQHMRTEAWTLLRTPGYSDDDCQHLGGVIWLGLPHTPV